MVIDRVYENMAEYKPLPSSKVDVKWSQDLEEVSNKARILAGTRLMLSFGSISTIVGLSIGSQTTSHPRLPWRWTQGL